MEEVIRGLYERVLSRCAIFATARRIKKPRYVDGIGTGSWHAAKYVSRAKIVYSWSYKININNRIFDLDFPIWVCLFRDS